MPVEIGTLIVRASFGGGETGASAERLRADLARLRRDLRAEMEEMLAEAERRMRER